MPSPLSNFTSEDFPRLLLMYVLKRNVTGGNQSHAFSAQWKNIFNTHQSTLLPLHCDDAGFRNKPKDDLAPAAMRSGNHV